MRLFFCLSILKLSTDKYSKIQVYIVAGSVYTDTVHINAQVLLEDLQTKYVDIFGDYDNNEHLMEPIFTEFKGTVCFILLQNCSYNKHMQKKLPEGEISRCFCEMPSSLWPMFSKKIAIIMTIFFQFA